MLLWILPSCFIVRCDLEENRKSRKVGLVQLFSLTQRILCVIDQNKEINSRQLYRKSGVGRYETLERRLGEMQELSLIERRDEGIAEGSQTRGLKPKYSTHYRITDSGRQWLQLLSEQIQD